MNKLLCTIYDQNRLSSKILEEFIDKTPGLTFTSNTLLKVDVIFFDGDQDIMESFQDNFANVQVIVISSNKKYANAYFMNQICDFIHKSHLSYPRFLEAIIKVRENIISA